MEQIPTTRRLTIKEIEKYTREILKWAGIILYDLPERKLTQDERWVIHSYLHRLWHELNKERADRKYANIKKKSKAEFEALSEEAKELARALLGAETKTEEEK